MKFTTDPTEKSTAATDIILTFVALGGVCFIRWSILSGSGLWKLNIWSAALGLIGLAAALGCIAHGLVLSQSLHRRVWQVLNLSLALAVSLFVIAVAYDLWGFGVSLRVLPVMLAAGFGFYLATLLHPGVFLFFIVFETLSLVFAFAAYVYLAVRGELSGAGLMAVGVLLSIIAAGIQAKKSFVINIIWQFDHNGVYHLIQAAGLLFLIAGIAKSLSPGDS